MEKIYQLKSTDVTAVQWNGENKEELSQFAKAQTSSVHHGTDLIISTQHNSFVLKKGDYLVKDVNGTIFYYTENAFNKMYIPRNENIQQE